MKAIQKVQEPQAFADWKALANENWQPSYSVLQNPEKRILKDALMREQGFICCYCERRLLVHDCHIEHLAAQSEMACAALDYANLLCSCQLDLPRGTPLHCGNLKAEHALPVSPLESNCAERFDFSADGRIRARNEADQDAEATIKLLGLDIPSLRARRAGIIAPFLDESLTDEEWGRFVAGYLQQDAQGRYGEFWTTIKFLFQFVPHGG